MMPIGAYSAEMESWAKSDRVYVFLRRRIREFTLPPGAPIRRDKIARVLGVSTAPVSDAIKRLADDLLVEILPKRGSFVAPIQSGDVHEALAIRSTLQFDCARRVAETADKSLLAQLSELVHAQEIALRTEGITLFHDRHDDFHAMIFSPHGSDRALRFLATVTAPLERAFRLSLSEPGRPGALVLDNRRLLEALKAHDPARAVAAMRSLAEHDAAAIERTLASVSKQMDYITHAPKTWKASMQLSPSGDVKRLS